MKAIEMTPQELKELLKHMPEHLKAKLFELVKPDSGIDIVKEFVEKYEDDDMLDHILAHTASNLIRKISTVARELTKDRKKEGKKRISTIDLGKVVIECLKDEAKNIQKALDHHEEDCTKGDDCGAKH